MAILPIQQTPLQAYFAHLDPPQPPSQEDFDMTTLVKTAKYIAMALSLLLVSATATADDPPVTTQIVDLANKLNGVHPGFRAFHAKGVVVEGKFKASPDAARLSRAKLFDGSTVPVTVRFSDGNGMPNVPDGSPAANPHGMAIKYHLPGGADTDMVTNSLKFFPTGTGEDFRDLLAAIIASPPDAPKPTKLEQFFASHPNAPKAFGTAATPDSYADEEYHGINAFIFVSKTGQRQAVRYQLVPEKLVHLTPEEAAKQSPDFLSDELTRRVARKPVVFHLKAQLAEPGDQTRDGTQPWPDDRKVVELGVLTLNKVEPDSLEAEKKLLFMPTSLTDGIELSDDPLPSVRAAAYGVSFARRSQPGSASSGPDNMNGHTSNAPRQASTVSP
ncbi:MAG TPA: catalase family peroxidase [Burkholderiaceae bacterium]|nr:catalase family peroxidase [Burkholderiaceae bacterium]